MPSRRRFLAALFAVSAFMVDAAAAQGNGNGNGNGGGNGNGAGNGNGGGNSNAGSGNSNAGGNGKGKGNASTGTAAAPAPAPAATRPSALPTLRVRHRNGFEEEIEGGRYEMRDNRGRQIVNRAVRNSDYTRLRRLIQ